MIQEKWDYTDFSHEALERRGNYLIEVIDKIVNKATGEDVEKLPFGRVVVSWGPSSGKTTAIRQYLSKYALHFMIYATYRKEDVDSMYYDLIAMQEIGVISSSSKITKFHSNYDPGEEELQKSNIIVCTHERLMIEPPSVLYRVDSEVATHIGQCVRDEIIIDELPKFYKLFKVDNVMMLTLGTLNNEVAHMDRKSRLVHRYTRISHMIETYMTDKSRLKLYERGLIETMIKILNSQNISIKLENNPRYIKKFAYFTDMLAEKLFEKQECAEELDQIIYSILDIDVPKVRIFDGTGDLILKNSDKWVLSKSEKFCRNLKLNQVPKILEDSHFSRTISDSDQLAVIYDNVDKYVDIIKDILRNTSGKVLVYTWNKIKISEEYYEYMKIKENTMQLVSVIDNLPDYIMSLLDKEDKSRVSIIHYGSGKEKVTSKFSECETIIVMGKFFIPNSSIHLHNMINGTEITTHDYTKSLIIQAIYRTCARHGEPINIYFTDDYSESFVNSVMLEFDQVADVANLDLNRYYEIVDQLSYNSRNKKYYDCILEHIDELINKGQCIIDIEVPDKASSSYTKDYKLAIQKMVKGTTIEYQNITGTRSFRLSLKG